MHEEPSKSALKREAQRLQKIGLRLTQLKPDIRARIDLPDALREAIETHACYQQPRGGTATNAVYRQTDAQGRHRGH